jgi:cold shock protein
MLTGTVRMWSDAKGFGFIEPDGGGPDVFVHITRCADGLEKLPEGARVRFEERASRKQAGKSEVVDVMLV